LLQLVLIGHVLAAEAAVAVAVGEELEAFHLAPPAARVGTEQLFNGSPRSDPELPLRC
jgi:hypothetical protein